MSHIGHSIILILVSALVATSAFADKVVLLNGQSYEGEIVEETEEYIHMRVGSEGLMIDLSEIAVIIIPEDGDDGHRKPELPPPRWADEILGGFLGGVLGGVVGGVAGLGVESTIDPEGEVYDDPVSARFAGLFIGVGAGYVLGSAIGVYSVGDTPDETGSFFATLSGGLVGGLLGFPLGILPGVSLGSAVGFNETRRYRSLEEVAQAPVEGTKRMETDTVTPLKGIPPVLIRPSFSLRRATGQTIAGFGGGLFTGGVGAAAFGYLFTESHGYHRNRGTIGFLVGCALGSTIGVYCVGDNPSETASLLATLGSSAVAALVSQAISADAEVLSLALCPVGATVGFNLTRRYKSVPPPVNSGFINLRNGAAFAGLPSVRVRPDPHEKGVLVFDMKLLRVVF